jgi:hypothetical protein
MASQKLASTSASRVAEHLKHFVGHANTSEPEDSLRDALKDIENKLNAIKKSSNLAKRRHVKE